MGWYDKWALVVLGPLGSQSPHYSPLFIAAGPVPESVQCYTVWEQEIQYIVSAHRPPAVTHQSDPIFNMNQIMKIALVETALVIETGKEGTWQPLEEEKCWIGWYWPRRICWRWWQEAAGVCLDMLQGYLCIRRALSKKVMVSFS